MKQGHFVLCVSIAAALASFPAMAQAPVKSAASTNAAVADLNPLEMGRVTQTIDNRSLVTLQSSQAPVLAQAKITGVVPDSMPMNHMQLVLKRSAQREVSLNALIAAQHNPTAAKYQQWLTPQEYGQYFGVAPADIQAVEAWLVSQGFTVNGIYPNNMQIDFSGTAGQVRTAFHTQEAHYLIGTTPHVANTSNISIPAALRDVVAGVAGLNDIHPQPMHVTPRHLVWNAAKHTFKTAAPHGPSGSAQPQTYPFNIDQRGLSPADMATMYGVKSLLAKGITGKGVNIAVVEDVDMVPADWDQFRAAFNLKSYGGTFKQIHPAPAGIATDNCVDPDVNTWGESIETVLDAEWSTAMAPGANVAVVSCADFDPNTGQPFSNNFFAGVYIATMNLINGKKLPDIISASYGYGEDAVDIASKLQIDGMWQQAASEGISAFVSSGDSGTNASFNGAPYIFEKGISPNTFASSPYVTAVGGTDTADVLDGTTATYFKPTPDQWFGSALSYVPEIPWNESCGNGAAAADFGFKSGTVQFCNFFVKLLGPGAPLTAEGSSGGPSALDAKPGWESLVHGAANDTSRDIPDVALFGGSYNGYTYALLCTQFDNCVKGLTNGVEGVAGTSLSSPMFAGIQALVNQSMGKKRQGVAAMTLYPLAAKEYGAATGAPPVSLAACNADHGTAGTAACVFYNVTRGGISTNCYNDPAHNIVTPNCYNYHGPFGLTSVTSGSYTEAYPAHPGWSFASGLGSVNAANLVTAWKAYAAAK